MVQCRGVPRTMLQQINLKREHLMNCVYCLSVYWRNMIIRIITENWYIKTVKTYCALYKVVGKWTILWCSCTSSLHQYFEVIFFDPPPAQTSLCSQLIYLQQFWSNVLKLYFQPALNSPTAGRVHWLSTKHWVRALLALLPLTAAHIWAGKIQRHGCVQSENPCRTVVALWSRAHVFFPVHRATH